MRANTFTECLLTIKWVVLAFSHFGGRCYFCVSPQYPTMSAQLVRKNKKYWNQHPRKYSVLPNLEILKQKHPQMKNLRISKTVSTPKTV